MNLHFEGISQYGRLSVQGLTRQTHVATEA